MPKPSMLAISLFPLFIAAHANAAEDAEMQPMLDEGTRELSIHFSPDIEGAIGDTIFLEAGYGHFFADRFAVRGTVYRVVMEDIAGNDSDYRALELDIVAEYYFDTDGSFVPYVGATLGWRRSIFNVLDESGAVYGGRFGFKYFLADNVALDYVITYTLAGNDVYINDFIAEDHDLSSLFGIHVMF